MPPLPPLLLLLLLLLGLVQSSVLIATSRQTQSLPMARPLTRDISYVVVVPRLAEGKCGALP